jgi:type III restriction enzyme
VQKLLDVENAANPVEIVVHVDQLKEGWDVTNLYTIVPLRTADSRTLVEQSIGRGLRLPYGHRTGNAAVDRLTIVAHDRFQDIVDLANSKDSPLKGGFETVYVPTTKPTLVPLSPGYLEELGLATAGPVNLELGLTAATAPTKPIFTTAPERDAAREALEVIRGFEKMTKLEDLNKPEIQAEIVAQVKQRLLPAQGELPGTEALTAEQTISVVAKLTESLQQRMIAIPRITVTPRDGAASGFRDFDLDCSAIRQSYTAQDILTIDLTDNSAHRLGADRMRSLELQLENYIVRNLMDYDDIDYMANSELLYKLSGQLIAHLRSYLEDEDQVLSVLYANQKPFAGIVHAQMLAHFLQPETGFDVKVTRNFQILSESFASADDDQHAVDFHDTVTDLQGIRSMVFGGFQRCCYSRQRFDSDTERRFAVILDRDAVRWLKPNANDLRIYYSHDEKYHPDFVVETAKAKYLCETKAANDIDDVVVKLKAKAAMVWCQHASLNDEKPWKYVLIPHSAVQHAATLEGLVVQYSQIAEGGS